MAKTNKKKLKKLKKRVKSLEENQCYMEQQLDKLTEWLDDNIEVHYFEDEDDPKPMLKFDDLDLGFIDKLNQEELDAEDEVAILNAETNYLTNDEAEAEEYSYKIEALEAKLRAGGITHRISYEAYLQELVNEMRDLRELDLNALRSRKNPPTNSYRPL